MNLDAIVIAGGRGTRLGGSMPGDKADYVLNGRTLLERSLDAVALADQVIVVGPERPTRRQVRWCQEDPPGSGPPAALATALPLVRAELVAVCGVDMPNLATGLTVLRSALVAEPGAPVAALVSSDGGPQPLAAVWRREPLRRAVGAGLSTLRSAFDGIDWIRVDDSGGWAADIDEPPDEISESG